MIPKIENDIFNKLDLYLYNDNLRKSHIDSCFKFFSEKYNKLPDKLMKQFNKKISYFDFQDKSFHNMQKRFILNILKDNYIFEEKLQIEYNQPLNNNYFNFFKNYKKNNDIFIFNAHDFWTIVQSALPHNFNDITNFLENTNYIYFGYEIITNNKLEQVGCIINPFIHTNVSNIQVLSSETKDYLNKNQEDLKEYFYYDSKKNIILTDKFVEIKLNVLKIFCQNAKYIYTSVYDNMKYLQENNIENVKYFPPMTYSEENNYLPLQKKQDLKYDIIFYGNNINNNQASPYRSNIWKKVKEYSKINRIVYQEYDGNLTHDIKDEVLSQTKIVLHIPSYPNLKHFPWQKTMELICKKIFFIIEECEDIYKLDLDKVVVLYKANDIEDLNKKVSYYLDNPQKEIKLQRNYLIKLKTGIL